MGSTKWTYHKNIHTFPEAATRAVLCEKAFLEISQNSQENTYARVSFSIKLEATGLQLH